MIYINEDLSAASRDIFAKARRLRNDKLIQACWSRNGKIIIKSLTGSEVHLKCLADLRQFQQT
jgi:hypothetical protein